MKRFASVSALALCAALSTTPAFADYRGTTTTGTAVANVAGTIVQANYNDNGMVDGLVVGSSTLLKFPGRVCGGVTTLGTVGQAVTYSGTAYTNATSGMQAVRVSAFTNTTTAATYTAPVATTTTAYPATTGAITLLNFDDAGSVNGFLFTATGSTTPVLVKLGGAVRSTTLSPLLLVGTAVSVTGTTTAGETHCGTAAVSTVRATSVSVGGSTFTFGGHGR